MEIRRANREDSHQLLDLARRTPMVGSVSAYMDRSPDFFRFAQLQGDDCITFIAELDDVIIGCVSCVSCNSRIDGQSGKRLYLCDLKVAPEAGRRNLGKKLASLPIEMAINDGGYRIVDVDVIESNQRSLKVVSWVSKELCSSRDAGVFRTYQLMPFRKYPQVKGYSVRRARIEDIPEIAGILNETYKNHDCSPLFDQGALEKELKKDECFNIDCFRVAERDGIIVGCAAFWDQSQVRRTVVTAYSRKVKLTLAILSCLKSVLPIPTLPKPGQALEYLYFRFPGCLAGHQEALRAILHDECNSLRDLRKYHFIWAGFHEADPLLNVLSKTWKINMDVNLFHFDPSRSSGNQQLDKTPRRPVYVDLALI